jgi:NADH:ubiquinone oxidoreductase subunit F (NADH-binding)/NAD-dependent dihydropyrimidine dehydrogenase PreA subunit/(2Fe-2S) ferredoxin
MKRLNNIKDLIALREQISKEGVLAPGKNRIKICCGTGCTASGSHKVVKALEESMRSDLDIELLKTGCQGLCQKGPVMKVEPYGYFYQKVGPENVPAVISTYTIGHPARQLLYRESFLKPPIEMMEEVPFYKKQMRIVLRHNGSIDPCNINQYIVVGGYSAIEKMFSSMSAQDVITEVKKSNIRGRGGAGFPAGVKWEFARKSPAKVKTLIANGDEGDPGAFMDRTVMEGDPHSLLEGMIICAYAIGARYGFIYVRHEYPLAVKNLGMAIRQAEELGLLGKNILGTGFDFTVQIREGAGAFVCGEETALMASIQGERGFPRQRPPFPAEKGLWGMPTIINNVETLVNIPDIINKGAEWFHSIGTENSSGTKVFALTGKVKNTGLIEVPMGITLREIIFDIGGGIIQDKKFKAVQTGGPSGGCIPEQYLDLPADYDSLSKVGSIMGSGGMVVMDEDTCIVDVAKFFLSFTQSESCGKCPPCRIGTYQMLQILERITSGNGEKEDIDKLERLGRLVKAGSLCGLGQTAPNPVLTTIKYFRNEYEEHIRDKYCRAEVCTGLGLLSINTDICYQCRRCMDTCPFEAIKETHDGRFYIDQVYCQRCKACYYICPLGSIEVKEPPVYIIDKEICYLCGRCKDVCRANAIKETKTGYVIDRYECRRCGDCYNICPLGAVKVEDRTKVMTDKVIAIEAKQSTSISSK